MLAEQQKILRKCQPLEAGNAANLSGAHAAEEILALYCRATTTRAFQEMQERILKKLSVLGNSCPWRREAGIGRTGKGRRGGGGVPGEVEGRSEGRHGRALAVAGGAASARSLGFLILTLGACTPALLLSRASRRGVKRKRCRVVTWNFSETKEIQQKNAVVIKI